VAQDAPDPAGSGEDMKFAVISDIHANVPALAAVLDTIAAEKVDRIVCLGDVAGYHTEPTACVRLLQEAGALCVAGNHDRAVIGAVETEGFSPIAQRAVAWTRERLEDTTRDFLAALPPKRVIDGVLVAVHGALHPEIGCEWLRLDDDGKRALSLDALAVHPSGARVCAFGHTHRPGVWERRAGEIHRLEGESLALRADAWYLVNPGSVGEPRDDDPRASFLVFDSVVRSVRFHRVTYDRPSVLAKSRAAGLIPPQRLAWIPEPHRTHWKKRLRRWHADGFVLAFLRSLEGLQAACRSRRRVP
jgi:predicted phosphodiesterase